MCPGAVGLWIPWSPISKRGQDICSDVQSQQPSRDGPSHLSWGRLKNLDQLCGAEQSFLLVTFATLLPVLWILHLAVLHSCLDFEGGVSLPAVVSPSRIRQPPVPNKCSFYSCWGRNTRAQMRAVPLNMQCLGQSSSRGHPQIQHPWPSWAVWGWRAKPQLSISKPSLFPTVKVSVPQGSVSSLPLSMGLGLSPPSPGPCTSTVCFVPVLELISPHWDPKTSSAKNWKVFCRVSGMGEKGQGTVCFVSHLPLGSAQLPPKPNLKCIQPLLFPFMWMSLPLASGIVWALLASGYK